MYIKDLESLKRTSVFFMMKPVKAVYAFILVIILSFIVLFIWALFAPMEDVVKADVVIRPENDVSYIRCITSGQLLNKNYTNSSYVSRGDLLFTLDVDVLDKWKREYSEQVANGDLAFDLGIPRENIILKENGYVATFENGNLIDNFTPVKTGVISIDGESSDDVGELVLRDREILSDNGIVIVSATLDKKNKSLLSGPEILTRGFVYVKDSAELIASIKDICTEIITSNVHNNYIDYNKVKNTIRERLSNFLSVQTGNRPMIITVIQEI